MFRAGGVGAGWAKDGELHGGGGSGGEGRESYRF